MILRYSTLLCFSFILLLSLSISAKQTDKSVIAANISKTSYSLDTEASAVILYESRDVDVAVPVFAGNGTYMETQTIHRVIKILRKDAFNLASIKITHPNENNVSYLSDLRAVTYNASGAEFTEKSVERSSYYEKELPGKLNEVSFTFPDVREGSIIEYSYSIIRPFQFNMPSWNIQDNKYPKLLNIYTIRFPAAFLFVNSKPWSEPAKYETEEDAIDGKDDFAYAKESISSKRTKVTWIRRNIPDIKDEDFLNTIANYTETMDFRINGITGRNIPALEISSWSDMNSRLLKNDFFGALVNSENKFFSRVADSIQRANASNKALIRAVYSYIRNNYTAIPASGIFASTTNLNAIWNKGLGYTQELNLLLCAMLKHMGFDAYPVILAKVGTASLSPDIPMCEKANYVVCMVRSEDNTILLDASDKNNSFGILPLFCYNGYARIINDPGGSIMLLPDSIHSESDIAVRIFDLSNAVGKIQITKAHGCYTSSNLRKRFAADPLAQNKYLDDEARLLSGNITGVTSKILFLNNPDTCLVLSLTATIICDTTATKLFLSSAIMKPIARNPFSAVTRKLPVEFSCRSSYNYNLSLTLPSGIQPDSTPQPRIINCENGGYLYKKVYSYPPSAHTYTINTAYKFNTARLPASSYNSLRDFYTNIINEDNEFLSFNKASK